MSAESNSFAEGGTLYAYLSPANTSGYKAGDQVELWAKATNPDELDRPSPAEQQNLYQTPERLFEQEDSDNKFRRFWLDLNRQYGKESALAERVRSMGAHPSMMGTAPVPRLVDLPNAYRRFECTPADAVWPRATVRPTAGLNAGELVWSAKIWVGPGKEARVNGVWVTRASTSQEEVFWWAQKTVKEFREMAVFHRTGALGSRQRRWAPEW